MHAIASPETRLPDGRFAPGHSGNPAGRPKGSKGLGTRLVAALREGEDEIILRSVIEAALMGDKVAARFCAGRIDAAAREGEGGAEPPPGIAPADALNPYYLHAKLVQAVIEGTLPADRALGILRVAAAKRQLSTYASYELDDEEFVELGGTVVEAEEEAEEDDEQEEENEEEEEEGEEDEEAAFNPPPHAGEGGARAAAREGGGDTSSASECPLPDPPPRAGEGEAAGGPRSRL